MVVSKHFILNCIQNASILNSKTNWVMVFVPLSDEVNRLTVTMNSNPGSKKDNIMERIQYAAYLIIYLTDMVSGQSLID